MGCLPPTAPGNASKSYTKKGRWRFQCSGAARLYGVFKPFGHFFACKIINMKLSLDLCTWGYYHTAVYCKIWFLLDIHPHHRCGNNDWVLPGWASENTVGAPALVDLGGSQIGGFLAKWRTFISPEKKVFPWGIPKVELTGGTHRNITVKLESPRRGISRPIYGQMFNDVFKMLVDTPFWWFMALLSR